MSGVLHLSDPETLADLATFTGRAATLDEDGAIRLQADGSTLAAWVGVRKGRGLLGEGTVVGLKVLPLAAAARVDTVVPLRAVLDRVARLRPRAVTAFDIPPTTVRTSWAALTPPRSGWAPLGTVPIATLLTAARAGIEEVATGTPSGAGAAAVELLQQRVWSRAVDNVTGGADGLPAGAALGIHALGFGVGVDAAVFGTARWHRVSTPVGHVLVR